jgi:methionyl-tRNA synthetase
MVYKNCQEQIPTPGEFTPEDQEILRSVNGLRERAGLHVANQALHKYAETMIGMVCDTNKYIDTMEPWNLKKSDLARMGTVLYVIMEVLRYVAILYQPIIPSSANKILDLLQVPHDERTFSYLDYDYRITPGAKMIKPNGIFPRIEIGEALKV